jgi:hypothetical protein
VVLDSRPGPKGREYVKILIPARSTRWRGAAALAFAELDLLDVGVRQMVTDGRVSVDAQAETSGPPVVITNPEARDALQFSVGGVVARRGRKYRKVTAKRAPTAYSPGT